MKKVISLIQTGILVMLLLLSSCRDGYPIGNMQDWVELLFGGTGP